MTTMFESAFANDMIGNRADCVDLCRVSLADIDLVFTRQRD